MNTEEMRLVEWEEREPGEGRKRTRADELCHTRQGRSSKKQQGSVTNGSVSLGLDKATTGNLDGVKAKNAKLL